MPPTPGCRTRACWTRAGLQAREGEGGVRRQQARGMDITRLTGGVVRGSGLWELLHGLLRRITAPNERDHDKVEIHAQNRVDELQRKANHKKMWATKSPSSESAKPTW